MTTANTLTSTATDASHLTETKLPTEFLAFALDDAQYGVDIKRVQELRGYETVTRLANAPAFMKGVINLRGCIVPIIDMRIQFGYTAPSYDASTVVIILRIATRMIGIVVDSVSDVINISAKDIKPAPQLSNSGISHYLIGLATLSDSMLMLIDIERLMAGGGAGLEDNAADDNG